MKGINTEKGRIRHKVFTEVARFAYEGNGPEVLDELFPLVVVLVEPRVRGNVAFAARREEHPSFRRYCHIPYCVVHRILHCKNMGYTCLGNKLKKFFWLIFYGLKCVFHSTLLFSF